MGRVWEYIKRKVVAASGLAPVLLELDRLRDEAYHNEGVAVSLREGYLERGKEIERLQVEGERLFLEVAKWQTIASDQSMENQELRKQVVEEDTDD